MDMQWTGSNEAAIRDWLRDHYGEFPADWVEVMPDGSLMLLSDPCVFVQPGETIVCDPEIGPRVSHD